MFTVIWPRASPADYLHGTYYHGRRRAAAGQIENLAATVTLQHLLITLDDVAGGMLRPHLFCKPIAKRPEDREALLQAALSGHPPHVRQ